MDSAPSESISRAPGQSRPEARRDALDTEVPEARVALELGAVHCSLHLPARGLGREWQRATHAELQPDLRA